MRRAIECELDLCVGAHECRYAASVNDLQSKPFPPQSAQESVWIAPVRDIFFALDKRAVHLLEVVEQGRRSQPSGKFIVSGKTKHEADGFGIDGDTDNRVRLCTKAGMMMEDYSAFALSIQREVCSDLISDWDELAAAIDRMVALVKAAKALACE